METTFDITVIGGGPGGYVAAIRASQLGYKVALIEKYPTLGGTCTNVGCIPSKALLDSTEHYHNATSTFTAHGIEVGNVALNFEQLYKRKDEVVKQNTSGLNFLMKKNKIEVIQGIASFNNKNEVAVTLDDKSVITIKSTNFIIATGSKPSTIPGVVIDKKRIITSTEALKLTEKPKSIVIIGGGVIGVEMASIFARIGVQVSIVEYADGLIPTMDKELGKELKKVLSKLKIQFYLQSKVQSASSDGKSATVTFIDSENKEQKISGDYCLVAVGRKPYTDKLGLDKAGIETDQRGFIKVDHLRTSTPNIYAIGDVVGGAMLAHKAEEEGVFVAETINGQKPHINYNLIPGVVYSWPEVAAVGETEEQLKAKGISYRVGKFPFIASGRARASMDTDGFVKVLADTKYGEILGVHIIGPRAADLIAQAVVAMEYEVNDVELGKISYAHPTFAEALKEAYLISANGKGINI